MTKANDLDTSNIRLALLVTITVILVIAALRASYSVMMPLAAALFVVALTWPLLQKLEKRLPHPVAVGVTLVVVLAVFMAFAAALLYCFYLVFETAPKYSQEAESTYQNLKSMVQGYGVSLPPFSELGSSGGSSSGAVTTAAKRLLSIVGLFVIFFAFLALALPEMRQFAKRVATVSGNVIGERLSDAATTISEKYLRYFITRSLTSGITGVLTGAFALMMGLDLVFVWAFSSFLLNYIPTLGSLLAVIPPTLFALFQFQSITKGLIVFFGLCFIQFILGAYVDPMLEGKFLKISPLVILFSISFWGWVWGIPGALLGVPITVGLVIVCDHFEATRPFAELITDVDSGNEE